LAGLFFARRSEDLDPGMDLHGRPVIRRHRSLKRQDLLSQAIKGAADAATAAAGARPDVWLCQGFG
jgi:hypothetical protein